jgi:hypothetical protein
MIMSLGPVNTKISGSAGKKEQDMYQVNVNPELLATLLALVVAVAFDWFPGLRVWFDNLREMQKKTVMAGILAGIVLAIYGLGRAGVLAGQVPDLPALVQMYLVCIGINQGAHLLFKPAGNQFIGLS